MTGQALRGMCWGLGKAAWPLGEPCLRAPLIMGTQPHPPHLHGPGFRMSPDRSTEPGAPGNLVEG